MPDDDPVTMATRPANSLLLIVGVCQMSSCRREPENDASGGASLLD